MRKLRNWAFKGLMLLTFVALPGADIECEDDEIEIDWPDIDWDDDDDECCYYDEWWDVSPCCGWW